MKYPETCKECGGIKSPIILETDDKIDFDIKICDCNQSSGETPT